MISAVLMGVLNGVEGSDGAGRTGRRGPGVARTASAAGEALEKVYVRGGMGLKLDARRGGITGGGIESGATERSGQPQAVTKELITTKGTKGTKARSWRRIDIHAKAQRRKDAKEIIEGAVRDHGGRGIEIGATKSTKNTEKLRDDDWFECTTSARRASAGEWLAKDTP